jgi:hypothetical protein
MKPIIWQRQARGDISRISLITSNILRISLGVSHLLVGTYDLRPFRKINAQLACRSVDIHFPRYGAANEEEAQAFRSVLWALQRQLPVEQEPELVEQWEFLYARSIECVGLVKMHLNRALALALTEKRKIVTPSHLRKTALPEARVELALRNALESETELAEVAGADERLLTLLGLRGPRPASSQQMQEKEPPSSPHAALRPGKRGPGRDEIGGGANSAEQEAAG